MGMPAVDEQYEFTSGVLSNDGKDVEFRIDVDVMRGQYFVNPTELLELKVRAAKLFAGIEGKTLLAASERAAAASSDITSATRTGAFIEPTIAVEVGLTSPCGEGECAARRSQRPRTERSVPKQPLVAVRSWPILLKNSVRELERATLRKPTSQIDSGSTIATSPRVE